MKIKKSNIVDGNGLFTTKQYKKGETVHILTGIVYNKPTRETIHIGNNNHIYDKYGIYINHSFTPNIKIVGRQIISLCDINKNEELLFNYNDTEINMANPFYVNNLLVSGNHN